MVTTSPGSFGVRERHGGHCGTQRTSRRNGVALGVRHGAGLGLESGHVSMHCIRIGNHNRKGCTHCSGYPRVLSLSCSTVFACVPIAGHRRRSRSELSLRAWLQQLVSELVYAIRRFHQSTSSTTGEEVHHPAAAIVGGGDGEQWWRKGGDGEGDEGGCRQLAVANVDPQQLPRVVRIGTMQSRGHVPVGRDRV